MSFSIKKNILLFNLQNVDPRFILTARHCIKACPCFIKRQDWSLCRDSCLITLRYISTKEGQVNNNNLSFRAYDTDLPSDDEEQMIDIQT